MRGLILACLLGTLTAVGWCAPAQAAPGAQPRIINGHEASAGEYPAQGVLLRNGAFTCGGTLVSNRYFLTAAHCVTNDATGALLPRAQFSVRLGSVERSGGELFTFSALVRNADYDFQTLDNDSALFTLSTPSTLEPMRLVEAGETPLWAPGKTATVIGWGKTEDVNASDRLLEATVPMVSDAYCGQNAIFGSAFNPATMVCAGGGDTDTCNGDSGGPLMVSDGAFPVLVGLTSWGEEQCATPDFPGVYTRLGDPALNAWVRTRVPMVRASVSDAAPDPGQTVTFTATTSGPAALTGFAWDFDSDGDTDATGSSVTHAYPTAANVIARVSASGVNDTARDKLALRVGDPSATPTPTSTPTPPATTPVPQPAAPAPRPVPVVASGPLATILVSGRPRVRRGRFTIRVRFAATAPPRTAVVEVIRKRRVIGIARTKVLQGGTKRLRVKLTPRGRRLLARSRTHRLELRVRVRVGRQVLRTRTVTVRR